LELVSYTDQLCRGKRSILGLHNSAEFRRSQPMLPDLVVTEKQWRWIEQLVKTGYVPHLDF